MTDIFDHSRQEWMERAEAAEAELKLAQDKADAHLMYRRAAEDKLEAAEAKVADHEALQRKLNDEIQRLHGLLESEIAEVVRERARGDAAVALLRDVPDGPAYPWRRRIRAFLETEGQ
jgi:DNA-binding Lrp family transcriptional regulator